MVEEAATQLVEEAATQDQSKKEWRVLKSPSSPKILVPTNQQLSRQTDSVRSDIESSFQQRKTRDRKRVVTDIADLSEALSEFKREEKDTIKNWLLSERIPKIQAQGDKLSEERGLSQSEMWTDEDVATLYRQVEVLQYEAAKDENNGFLKCFDISSLNGSNIRSLNHLNETLLKYRSTTHISDGKIFSFKDGVRIVIDTRKTLRNFLRGKGDIVAYVGWYHQQVCLQGNPKIPGADWVATLVLASGAGWPEPMLKSMDGDGRLSINYQLGLWGGEEYHPIEELINQHYNSMAMGEMIHSIEVYSRHDKIIIGTLSKENAGILIGKSGRNITELRQSIKSQFGKSWKIFVEKLE